MGGHSWPDGRGFLDQPMRLVEAFQSIGGQMRYWDKEAPK